MLFSSHQLDLVQDICEAVAIIHRGRLVARGTASTELRRGGEPRLAVRVAGDPAGRWAGGLPAAARVIAASTRAPCPWRSRPARTRRTSSTRRAPPAPVEHFAVEDRRRLSEVFREAVGARRRRSLDRAAQRGAGLETREASARELRWLGVTIWLIAARELRQGLARAVLPHRHCPARGGRGGRRSSSRRRSSAARDRGEGRRRRLWPAPPLSRRSASPARITGGAVQAGPLRRASAKPRRQLRNGKLARPCSIPGREVLIARTPSTGTPAGASSLSGALALAGGLASGSRRRQPPGRGACPIRGLSPPLTGLSVRLTGLAVSIVIYMIILIYGVRITVGVSEEKSSRVIEVLLAAVRPSQLLSARCSGLGILALRRRWRSSSPSSSSARSSARASSTAPPSGRGRRRAWIVVGYAFYCTAYAAAGSLVSKPSDAYNASLPVQRAADLVLHPHLHRAVRGHRARLLLVPRVLPTHSADLHDRARRDRGAPTRGRSRCPCRSASRPPS